MILTVTPNPSVDLTYRVPAIVRGELHRAHAEPAEPSGKGINITRALAANNVGSTAVFPCGGATGATLEALLGQEGIAFVPVPMAGAVRINVAVVEPGGSATKFNAPGPGLEPSEARQLSDVTAGAAGRADWVVASGSLPPGVQADFYASLCRRVHDLGARFALDTSGPALAAGLAAGPDVVKPNVEELAELTGRSLRTLGDAVAAGRDLGAATVVVSAGVDGALLIGHDLVGHDLVGHDRVLHAEAGVAAPVSTVGAGDALLAGLLAGSSRSAHLGLDALVEAVAWAAASLRLPGSRVPMVTDADRRLVRATERPDLHRVLASAVRPLRSGGS